jgi:hypothetical protein
VAGHASVTTSQGYVHAVPETLMRAIEKLDATASKTQNLAGLSLKSWGNDSQPLQYPLHLLEWNLWQPVSD